MIPGAKRFLKRDPHYIKVNHHVLPQTPGSDLRFNPVVMTMNPSAIFSRPAMKVGGAEFTLNSDSEQCLNSPLIVNKI